MSRAGQIPDGGFAQDLVRSMQCGLIIVDDAARIRTLNERAAQVLEIDAEGAVGESASKALAVYPNLARLLSQSLSLETLPDRAELEIRSRDREGRTLGFTLSRVVGHDGTVRGAVLMFKDLTPIEQEAERLRLQERLAALGSMAASLAHEIRNPLAALEVTSTLLRRRLKKRDGETELVETLQDQVRRLSGTVNSCLEYVRPMTVEKRPCDLAGLIDEALEAAAVPEKAARVTVIKEVPDDLRPVPAEQDTLRQALLNIILNACEAMAEKGGVLKISLEVPLAAAVTPGSTARLRIADSGPGIPDDIRQKIFNPFFSTKPQGSGLGLAWTRKVIDAHAGVLDVESRLGEGTAFVIRLPLPAAANASDVLTTGELLHEAQDSGC